MKKILFPLSFLLVALFSMTSCESGTHIYLVKPVDETPTSLYTSFAVKYLDKLDFAITNAGFSNDISGFYMMDGSRSACDRKIRQAVDNAINTFESEDGYNSLIVVSGLELEIVYYESDEKQTQIYSRKFK